MTEVASSVVQEVLGPRAQDVDQPIIDYIINVLADEDFDFGIEGEGAFEAIGELLVDSGCVTDHSECRLVYPYFRSNYCSSFQVSYIRFKDRAERPEKDIVNPKSNTILSQLSSSN